MVIWERQMGSLSLCPSSSPSRGLELILSNRQPSAGAEWVPVAKGKAQQDLRVGPSFLRFNVFPLTSLPHALPE